MSQDYYVYVYIDPRDFTEFYYGKGTGDRRFEHLRDKGNSEKAQIIRAILQSGLEPIIRVVAKDLTENEAFLVEKSLLWKLGRNLSNVSSGKFNEKFRPEKSLGYQLDQFDSFQNVYFVNVNVEDWEDCYRLDFVVANGGVIYGPMLKRLNIGDVVCVYAKRSKKKNINSGGYVGIGIVEGKAVPYREFKIGGKHIRKIKTTSDYDWKSHSDDDCAWFCQIKWIKKTKLEKGFFQSGLFAKQKIVMSLAKQRITRRALENYFGISFQKILRAGLRLNRKRNNL